MSQENVDIYTRHLPDYLADTASNLTTAWIRVRVASESLESTALVPKSGIVSTL